MAQHQIAIEVDPDVFERLQQLATPLVDDVNSVLRRLLGDGEGTKPPAMSAVGDGVLPVGLRLSASYRPRDGSGRFEFAAIVEAATVRFEGWEFDSLSGAAVAAKESVGVSGEAAQTDGWEFWKYRDHAGRLVPVAELRRAQGKTGARRGRMRSLGAWASGHADTSVAAGEQPPIPRS